MPANELPSPPFIPISGVFNTRDAGGYPIAGQPTKMVRRGVLFRSSDPLRATPDGITQLQQLGITHIFDLKHKPSDAELADRERIRAEGRDVAQTPSEVPAWDGAVRVHAPFYMMGDHSPAAIAQRNALFAHKGSEGFQKIYGECIRLGAAPDHPYRPIATVLRHLSRGVDGDEPPKPCMVYCAAGKDRTGTTVAIVLSLCGVADEVVAHEYALTDLGMEEHRSQVVDFLVTTEGLKGDRAGAERMTAARKEYMLATLSTLRATYGSVEDYAIKQCGLTSDDVDQLRRNLVVEIAYTDDTESSRQVVDWEAHEKMIPVKP